MTTKVSVQDWVGKQVELWNDHDAAAIAAGYAPNAIVRDPYYTEPLTGRAAIEKDAADFFAAFPDLHFQISNIIAEGDTVAVEGKCTGTHTGPLSLPTGLIPATNKRMEFAMSFFTTLDEIGNVREEHRYYDVATQMEQLGLLQ